MTRAMSTPYLEWAKLHSTARWNLATSGIPAVPLEEIGGWPDASALTQPNGYGYAPLLERVAAHHGVTPAQVVTTTGCSMANFLAMAALVSPGDEVLVERPTYDPLLLAAAHLGARITRFERGANRGFAVDVDAVAAAIGPRTRLIVIANLHNPSSALIPNDALARIGEAAAAAGARVLLDEVYLDTVFDAHPGSSIHLGLPFVVTSSLTKTYGLSPLRCGWVLADEDLARRMWRLQDLYGNVMPATMDVLAVQAFDRLPALRARSRALLEANRATFIAWHATHSETLHATVPVWGTTVCARPAPMSADTFCERLRLEHDVSVVPGRFFEEPDYVRISLTAEPATLAAGLERMGRVLTDLEA
jgi:aspartate/methionine/tyrosine aminotransferase